MFRSLYEGLLCIRRPAFTFKSDELGMLTQPNVLSLVQCEQYLRGQLVYFQPVLGLNHRCIRLARIYFPVEASSWHFLPLVQAQNDTGATSNSAETDVSETLLSSLIFVDPERNESLSDPCNNFILHFLPLIICILGPSVMSRRGITLAVIFVEVTLCDV